MYVFRNSVKTFTVVCEILLPEPGISLDNGVISPKNTGFNFFGDLLCKLSLFQNIENRVRYVTNLII